MTLNRVLRHRVRGRRVRPTVTLTLTVLLCGCAGLSNRPRPPTSDPFEPVNRAVYRFNDTADRYVIRPVAKGYSRVAPPWLQTRVTSFFTNLGEPANSVNGLLQGSPAKAGTSLLRFVINSTVGLGGLFDVAGRDGLKLADEDLGQTLAVWGVPSGPYLVVPFLGPYSLRHGIGALIDTGLHPVTYVHDREARVGLVVLYGISQRAQLLGADRAVREAFDPYIFVREAYMDRRQYRIYDGDPPQAPLELEVPEDGSD